MLPQLLRKLLVAAAFVGIITTCSPLTNRAVPSSFNLYVYGPGNIGGFPVVYNNGSTAAVDPALFTARSDLVNVTFSPSHSDPSIWKISSNGNGTAFSNSTLALGVQSSDSQLGFAPPSNDSWSTAGWRFYGSTVMWETDSGELQTRFYATNTSLEEGMWALQWDVEETEGVWPVALRRLSPSSYAV